MNLKIRIQLSAMMFLQFFIWSVWFVTMGPYLRDVLKFTPQQIGLAYNSTGLAAMISPFFVGMVADRFFATEKILAVLHLAGAALMFAISRATSFEVFYPLLIGYTLCFMPTLALANTLALKQMTDPGKQFSRVVVFGTIGWIAAGQLLGLFGARATGSPISFQLACAASFVMGLYSLCLPHTPPKGAGQKVTARDILGLDALQLLKEPSFALFVIVAFLFCIPLNLYFSFAPSFLGDFGVANIPGTMTLGQVSEMFFMVVMPFFLAHLGIKWVFALGMLGWSLRYLLFYLGYGSGGMAPLYGGVAMHGICYVFFFVLAYIYVDKKAPEAIRTKAQGFISLVTLGAGFFVGANVSGWLVQNYSFPNAEPAKFKVIQKGAPLRAGDFVMWESGQANFGVVAGISAGEPNASVALYKIEESGFVATGQTNSLPVNTLAKAILWAKGDYVKWDRQGAPAYGKISKFEASGPAAVVDVYEKQAGGFKSSGKTETVPLVALAKPMTLWGQVWLLAAISGLVILVVFSLLFKHTEPAPPKQQS
jgi:nucleoside transporter